MRLGRAGRLLGAAAAGVALMAGPVLAGRIDGSATPDWQPSESAPAPGWIPRWDTYLGGFRQLDEIALESPQAGWGVDSVLLGQVEHTVFVRIAQDKLRAVQTVTGLDVRGLDADGVAAFAAGKTPTGLDGYLKQRGISKLFVAGLATDICVAWTALDARRLGYETWVIEDACRAIDLNDSLAAAWKEMTAKGVQRIQSTDLLPSKTSTG